MSDGEADLQGQANPAAARRLGPELRPRLADPVQKWLAPIHVRRTLMRRKRRPVRPAGPGDAVWDSQPMGEFELLAKLRERLRRLARGCGSGSGDDAAVTVPGGATATSVDALVDGVHFRREQAEPGADRAQGPRRRPLRPGGDGRGAG